MINGPLSDRGERRGPADFSFGAPSVDVRVASPPRILIIPSERAENGEVSGEISRRLMRRFISLTFQSIILRSWDFAPFPPFPLCQFPYALWWLFHDLLPHC